MSKQTGYRRAPDDAVILRPLDDITLLYHRPSGQTHMVVSPVPEIWAAMDPATVMDADQVRERLALSYELDDAKEDMRAAIAAHLDEMAALGLVRRA